MKKLFAILAVLAISASISFAVDFNAGVDATANFTGTVIAPLQWTAPNAVSTITLPNGIAGQHRMGITGCSADFVLQGESGKSVQLTAHLVPMMAICPVTLDYTWSLDPTVTQTLTGVLGTLTETFAVQGVNAQASAHGTYTWHVSVDAVYTGI